MKIFPTLYSRTATGAIQTWRVIVDGDSYYTEYGQLNGVIISTNPTVCKGTNVNRANENSPQDQAMFEAQAMWNKKKDTGYHTDITKIDTSFYIEPMLAKKWEDRKDKVKFPVYCQPKLDGMRAIITKDGAKSRNGKPWMTIPHILKTLEPVFDRYPQLILDGELYNHEYKDDFNKMSSLIKKVKPTAKDLDESCEKVQFWWYDTASSEHTFSQRSNWIRGLQMKFGLDKPIVPVYTYLCKTQEELDRHYESFLNNGFEGQMVRENTVYEFKRSSGLLKRKEFQDSEYTILDIVEGLGNKSGMAGAMIFENELGHSFNSNIKGDREFLKELLDNKHYYIGKEATVRYFNLTPDKQIPRFPYVYAVHLDGKD